MISNSLAIRLGRGPEDHIKVKSEYGKGSKFSFVVQNLMSDKYEHVSPGIK